MQGSSTPDACRLSDHGRRKREHVLLPVATIIVDSGGQCGDDIGMTILAKLPRHPALLVWVDFAYGNKPVYTRKREAAAPKKVPEQKKVAEPTRRSERLMMKAGG